MERLHFVTVAAFEKPWQAWIYRNYLADHGLDAFVIDEFYVGLEWWRANAAGGVKVQVPAHQVPRLPTDPEPLDLADFPPANHEQAIGDRPCGRCGLPEIATRRFSRRWAYATFLFSGIPWPIPRRSTICLGCGGRTGEPQCFHLWQLAAMCGGLAIFFWLAPAFFRSL